jgi:hypothetical protein
VIRQRFRIFNLRASISSIVFVLLGALWGRSIRENFGSCSRLRRLMMTEYTVVASCAVATFVKVADTVVVVFALFAFGTLPFGEICAE